MLDHPPSSDGTRTGPRAAARGSRRPVRLLAATVAVAAAFVGLTAWPSQAAAPVAGGVYTLASG
ncbi:hypothetical protein, partial [Sphaerisporangium rufum]|uniref:hypothetical protein n=1 Tax=Sphaerisporangium rufum TaxID=1381558 RepID=UPI00194FF33C